VKTAAVAVGSLKDTEFDIRFNPDVYSPGIKHCDHLDPPIKSQRQLVKDAAEFLLTVQIPTFVSPAAGEGRSEAPRSRDGHLQTRQKASILFIRYSYVGHMVTT
jgi:hypothetical protein